MVDLVRAGRTPEDLAKEFEPTAKAIRNWGQAVGARREDIIFPIQEIRGVSTGML
jgi:transposase